MSFKQLSTWILFVAFLALGFGLFGRGVAAVERFTGSYPILSQETVGLMSELEQARDEFSRSCECYKKGRNATTHDGQSCDGLANESALDAAKERRQSAAAQLNPSLPMAVLLGVYTKTHSTWQCSGTAWQSVFNVNPSLTPTYDPPTS